MNSDLMVTVAVAATWVAILGLIAWSVQSSWRRVMANEGTLPFFAMLKRRGVDVRRLQDTSHTLYTAVRRCAMCRQQATCTEWLSGRGGQAPDCPNSDYMDHAARS